ncbi:MAG: signal peptidase I [Clostridiales bacterium]|nr:signal peptidase I [Clostridiales bacterium]
MSPRMLENGDLEEQNFNEKERKPIFRYLAVFLALFLLLILGVRIYFTKAFGGVVIDGASMNQTLHDGQRLLMRPVDEKHQADYGDVIVVYVGNYPEFQEVGSPDYIIKRLIAKGGDKVYCENGQVYVQYGGVGDYVAISEPYAYYMRGAENYSFEMYEVQEGEIFFLGDNRQNSKDSRYKTNHSQLADRLYKAEDVYGVVPDWAIKHDGILSLFLFHKCSK